MVKFGRILKAYNQIGLEQTFGIKIPKALRGKLWELSRGSSQINMVTTESKKSKKENNTLQLTKFSCLHCQCEYEILSVLKQSFKLASCANCHPAYNPETNETNVFIGNAELFYRRQEKAKR